MISKQADYFIVTAFPDILHLYCGKITIDRVVYGFQIDTKSLLSKVFFHARLDRNFDIVKRV